MGRPAPGRAGRRGLWSRASIPRPSSDDTASTGEPASAVPASSPLDVPPDLLDPSCVDDVDLGDDRDPVADAKGIEELEVLERLGARAVVRGHDEHRGIDLARADEHVADQAVVPGHVDEIELACRPADRGGRSRRRSSSRAGAPRAAGRRRSRSGPGAAPSCRGRCGRRCRRRRSSRSADRGEDRRRELRRPARVDGPQVEDGRRRPRSGRSPRASPSAQACQERDLRDSTSRSRRRTTASVSPGSEPPPTVACDGGDLHRGLRRPSRTLEATASARARRASGRRRDHPPDRDLASSPGPRGTGRASRRARPASPCRAGPRGPAGHAGSGRSGRPDPRSGRPAARRPACRR